MAKEVINNATIIYAHVEVSAEGHECSIESNVEQLVVTNYASTGWEELLGGIRSGEISLNAFLNDTADPGKTFWDIDIAPIFIAPERPPVAGNRAFALNGLRSRQNLKYQVGQVKAVELAISNNQYPVMRGRTLHHADGIEEYFSGGTVTGTAVQAGAVSAAQRGYGLLQVRSISGTSPTLDAKIQSDDASGFASATDRITFAQVTDLTALSTRYQLLSVAGAITDDWWRGLFTIGGTGVDIDLTLFFAIA